MWHLLHVGAVILDIVLEVCDFQQFNRSRFPGQRGAGIVMLTCINVGEGSFECTPRSHALLNFAASSRDVHSIAPATTAIFGDKSVLPFICIPAVLRKFLLFIVLCVLTLPLLFHMFVFLTLCHFNFLVKFIVSNRRYTMPVGSEGRRKFTLASPSTRLSFPGLRLFQFEDVCDSKDSLQRIFLGFCDTTFLFQMP